MIRKKWLCVFISVRLDHAIATIQLTETVELDKYVRLQVHILHNEIRARLNDGNISSRKSIETNVYCLWRRSSFLKECCRLVVHSRVLCTWAVFPIHWIRMFMLLSSTISGVLFFSSRLYRQFHLDEGFQGCIHALSINERRLTFNNSEHHTVLSAQNIGSSINGTSLLFYWVRCVLDECIANPCRSGVATCRNGTHCVPIRNNDANSYKCLCDDYLSSLSPITTSNDCSTSTVDHCSLKPCEQDQQCVHVYPNNYSCICLNCSSGKNRSTVYSSRTRPLI
jgi:hypothetical protein